MKADAWLVAITRLNLMLPGGGGGFLGHCWEQQCLLCFQKFSRSGSSIYLGKCYEKFWVWPDGPIGGLRPLTLGPSTRAHLLRNSEFFLDE